MKPAIIDTPKMMVALLLTIVIVVGILSGYNPFEFLAPPDENRKPGTWINAPLSGGGHEEEIQGNPRLLPESELK